MRKALRRLKGCTGRVMRDIQRQLSGVTDDSMRQKMGWLPPSPDGIAMCQSRGVQRHKKERTANERYIDRGRPYASGLTALLERRSG